MLPARYLTLPSADTAEHMYTSWSKLEKVAPTAVSAF